MGREIEGAVNELGARLFGAGPARPVAYPMLPPKIQEEPDPAYTPRQNPLNVLGSRLMGIAEDPRNAWIGAGPVAMMAKIPKTAVELEKLAFKAYEKAKGANTAAVYNKWRQKAEDLYGQAAKMGGQTKISKPGIELDEAAKNARIDYEEGVSNNLPEGKLIELDEAVKDAEDKLQAYQAKMAGTAGTAGTAKKFITTLGNDAARTMTNPETGEAMGMLKKYGVWGYDENKGAHQVIDTGDDLAELQKRHGVTEVQEIKRDSGKN
jgi:hypothetical protein